MVKLLVIGIDAATWKVIKPNIDQLPTFKKLINENHSDTIVLGKDYTILSPAIWCSMFSGKSVEEHGHKKFVKDGKIVERKDINVKFIWDILNDKYDIRALQVPFIVPPYNFNCNYEPVDYGLSYDINDLEKSIDNLTLKAIEILEDNPDIFIVVYNELDRLQHFHWGEPIVLEFYKKIDRVLNRLIKYSDKLTIISDHGFCSKGEARIQTLPDKNDKGEELKGDHHEEAILITKNINYTIKKPEDVFYAILNEMEQ
ncbi:MAG: alkaline phosphatase family protein [Candidatus Aenigmarchaeota archaeon]|nr:alkaline phosphatase family protein [Candidatus Aenigmarchaeota archaeon]